MYTVFLSYKVSRGDSARLAVMSVVGFRVFISWFCDDSNVAVNKEKRFVLRTLFSDDHCVEVLKILKELVISRS